MEKFKKGAVLITGTTSGVGLNTLKPLIEFGWDIIAVNRSSKRAIDEANKILKNNEIESINFIEIDLRAWVDYQKNSGLLKKDDYTLAWIKIYG